MKRLVLIFLLIPTFVLFVVSSCKKEEEETLYMTGTTTYDFPMYGLKGETIETYSTGVSYPKGVTYFWYSSALLKDTVFGQSLKVTLPDTTGSFTLIGGAKYTGYYSSVSTKTITIIDPDVSEGSLKGIAISDSIFIDERDWNDYRYVTIGNLQWFTQNLRYAGTEDNPVGRPYSGAVAISLIFGNLYTWEDATGGISASGLGCGVQGACPEGWSVPTREDWEDLGKVLNADAEVSFDDNWDGLAEQVTPDAYFNDQRMWPYCPDFTKRNTLGWNALPCGNSTDGYNRFRYIFKYGMWWSSTEADESRGSYRYIFYDQSAFPMHSISKTDFGASVRCVRLIP